MSSFWIVLLKQKENLHYISDTITDDVIKISRLARESKKKIKCIIFFLEMTDNHVARTSHNMNRNSAALCLHASRLWLTRPPTAIYVFII